MPQQFKDAAQQVFSAIDFLPGTSWAPLAEPVAAGSFHRLKMQAGAIIPAHTHPADEFVFVLSGELVTGGRRCSAGCFWSTPANTRQGPHEALSDVELLTLQLGPMGSFERNAGPDAR
jgi:anti-sigma factor ChrR (cupin superfamily)